MSLGLLTPVSFFFPLPSHRRLAVATDVQILNAKWMMFYVCVFFFFLCKKNIVITSLKIEKGLALQDLIAGAYEFLDTVELPKQSRIYLLDHLGSTE